MRWASLLRSSFRSSSSSASPVSFRNLNAESLPGTKFLVVPAKEPYFLLLFITRDSWTQSHPIKANVRYSRLSLHYLPLPPSSHDICSFCSHFPAWLHAQKRTKMTVIPVKSTLAAPIAPAYHPAEVEAEWYEWWEQQHFFSPSALTLHQRRLYCEGLLLASKTVILSGDRDAAGLMNGEKHNFTSTVPADVYDAACDVAAQTKPERKFIMVIPPPNVTGSLHIGHTLTVAIQDALARWHRMNGKIVLWIPGTDHAGIATQAVVERALLKDGVTRHDLGREKFVEKVWEWKRLYGETICNQLRRVGSSVSWPHFCFTLDEKLSRAVNEAFVRLYDAGLIYREKRLVSWSPYLKTAISEIEVDVEEIEKPTKISIPGFQYPVDVGYLWHFFYEVEGGAGKLEVATTRIETMLGDVAVAVHPEDERYKAFVGKRLVHPFFPERKMVVIADDHVDASFGTGAVKITPAHDKNDYAIAKRHNLPCIMIFTLDGRINEVGGPFAGQHRFECRYNILQKLKSLGLLGDRVPNSHKMQLPRCSRSGDIIEYMLIPQWWCSCSGMAAKALEKVRTGELQIIPAVHKDTWFYWLENIKEWCISRQLWWGHRIPAYRIMKPTQSTETWVVGRTYAEALDRARKVLGINGTSDIVLEQDEDVLDTWFSSGLFPFSVLGWPEISDEFKAYFPTTILETGHDILFFWVARMVMLSLELTGQLPFSKVFLHAMVRDAHGQKMSKSKGNVVDPLEIIAGISLEKLQAKLHLGNLPEKEIKRAEEVLKKEFPQGIAECGCDALRMGLLAYTRQGRNVNLDLSRITGYRHFCNKLWNATKFALDKFALAPTILYGNQILQCDVDRVAVSDDGDCSTTRFNCNNAEGNEQFAAPTRNMIKTLFVPHGVALSTTGSNNEGVISRIEYMDLKWVDRWILHRLSTTCAEVARCFDGYSFSEAVTSIFNFFLYDFCDYYLEVIKSRLTPSTIPRSQDEQVSSLCALEVLHICLDRGLRLLHPICPFVTEELHQRLPRRFLRQSSISITDFPQPTLLWLDMRLDSSMALFQNVISRFRSLLAALEVHPKIKPAGYICVASGTQSQTLSSETLAFLSAHATELADLAKLSIIEIRGKDYVPRRCVSDVVTSSVTIFLSVEKGVNFDQTLEKMMKKEAAMKKLVNNYESKEASPGYKGKVPFSIRQLNSTRKAELQAELSFLQQALRDFRNLRE